MLCWCTDDDGGGDGSSSTVCIACRILHCSSRVSFGSIAAMLFGRFDQRSIDRFRFTTGPGDSSTDTISAIARVLRSSKSASEVTGCVVVDDREKAEDLSCISTGEIAAATRVCSPYGYKTPNMTVEEGFLLKVLVKIQGIYGQVNLGGGGGTMDAGFCFGLLDPISNIIAGTAIVKAVPAVRPAGERAWYPLLIRDMEARSLIGLIAFLTSLFPYLPDYKAVRYLDLADADPIVAARLIIKDRGMEDTFGYSSDTTISAVNTALRCAAAAAQHPSPDQFVSGWSLLSTCDLAGVVASPADPNSTSSRHYNICRRTSNLLTKKIKLKPDASSLHLNDSWDLALRRLHPDRRPRQFPGRDTMKRILLATIHGFYMQALARLPTDELQSRYHRSMLQHGHCYGPLDPVSNIVLNTVWYESAFPITIASKQRVIPKLQMISTEALHRITVQSFYGLISFLCTRFHDLTPNQAMLRLQDAGAHLLLADHRTQLDLTPTAASAVNTHDVAYAAAAAAARHPHPDAQKELLLRTTCNNGDLMKPAVELLQDGNKRLSSEDILFLISSLFTKDQQLQAAAAAADQESEELKYSPGRYSLFRNMQQSFWNQHDRACRMVKSALNMYCAQPGVPKYELHAICGVNEHVNGPRGRHIGYSRFTLPERSYDHAHINFLAAARKDDPESPMVLFFAQCCNAAGNMEDAFCCPVSVPPPDTEQARCLYCEFAGLDEIVHPTSTVRSFHGCGQQDLVKVMTGEGLHGLPDWYTNDVIFSKSGRLDSVWGDVEDDTIYTKATLDDKEMSSDERYRDWLMWAEIG